MCSVGILHTWGRNLAYHPHIHYLIPAGGLAADAQTWLPARQDFLLPVKALSRIFRGKFRQALARTALFARIPSKVWQQEWVVHCKPVGNGRTALKYLAPYVFRVAISNRRLVKLENDQVTFRYHATDTGQLKLCTLSAEEFIHRFLQHVLPKGFVKVRYFGFFASTARAEIPGKLGSVRNHARASRFRSTTQFVLPKLRSAHAFPTHDSTYWTLPTVSGCDSPRPLIHWMLDFALAPLFPLVSCQEIFIRWPLSPDPWLVLTDFFVVQSMYIRQSDGGVDLIVCLKFQIARCVG